MPVTTRSRSLSLRIHETSPTQRMTRSRPDSHIPYKSSIVCKERKNKRYNTRSSSKRFIELSSPEQQMTTRSMTRFINNYT